MEQSLYKIASLLLLAIANEQVLKMFGIFLKMFASNYNLAVSYLFFSPTEKCND